MVCRTDWELVPPRFGGKDEGRCCSLLAHKKHPGGQQTLWARSASLQSCSFRCSLACHQMSSLVDPLAKAIGEEEGGVRGSSCLSPHRASVIDVRGHCSSSLGSGTPGRLNYSSACCPRYAVLSMGDARSVGMIWPVGL